MKTFKIIKYIIPLIWSLPITAEENYKITNVIDGDTIEFEAPFLPQPLKPSLSLRIDGVDTPELHSPKCDSELQKAKEAKDFTQKVIHNAKNKTLVFKHWDKFGGRVDGDIILDGISLSELLLKNNKAREYHGEKKQSWCEIQ